VGRKGLQRKSHRICRSKSEELERKDRLVAILLCKIAARPCVLGFWREAPEMRAYFLNLLTLLLKLLCTAFLLCFLPDGAASA
jgi:hypothetical protein